MNQQLRQSEVKGMGGRIFYRACNKYGFSPVHAADITERVILELNTTFADAEPTEKVAYRLTNYICTIYKLTGDFPTSICLN